MSLIKELKLIVNDSEATSSKNFEKKGFSLRSNIPTRDLEKISSFSLR